MTGTRHLDAAIEKCIIFLIIFTPFAFGSVGIGPQIVLISVSELAFFLWFASAIKSDNLGFKGNIFIYLFAAFLALVIFQTIPFPKFLLKILSPATYKNYTEFLPGYKEHFMWRSISVSPLTTQIELFKILSYGLISFVIASTYSQKEKILRLLTAISVTGFIIAFLGMIHRFTYNGMLYWFVSIPEGTGMFAPFVNKNHFAGYMELAIPITAIFVFIEERLEKKVFFGFMSAVMVLALFLSLSRAGILSFFTAVAILFLIIFLRRHLKKYLVFILPAVLLIFVFVFFIAKAPLIERFSTAPQAVESRWQIYRDIFRMFLDFPLFGIGLGNFAKIFSMYKTIGGDLTFSHADSDWLQLLAETGLIGFLCLVSLAWLFFKDILYCWNRRHDRFVLLAISAGFVSITSILLHGLVDINLRIPSNILLTFVIAALLMAAAHGKFEDAHR